MTEYKVVKAGDINEQLGVAWTRLDELVRLVNTEMNEGWRPHGRPFYHRNYWVQAMVK